MADGFLGRWSRRKLDVAQGRAVEAEPLRPAAAAPAAGPGIPASGLAAPPQDAAAVPAQPAGEPSAPPPTLQDVEALTADSDFSAFAARNVDPQVKNAAMKKLFADPRYNVMDGMDVYIDDYSKPDPMPQAMLRQLASAQFLGLFKEEEEAEQLAKQRSATGSKDNTDELAAQSVAQSGAPSQAVSAPLNHDDPDLRLQQDHAPPGEDPGRGAG